MLRFTALIVLLASIAAAPVAFAQATPAAKTAASGTQAPSTPKAKSSAAKSATPGTQAATTAQTAAATTSSQGTSTKEAAPTAVWTEGKHYFPVEPAQRTSVPPGTVEVMEVFSYGCPACAHYNPLAQKLKRSLPANAKMVYLPASFNPGEDWPMFQRAFCTAQALGVVDKTHDAMFDAVWGSGELAVSDPKTNRLKSPLPTIEDAARFYQRVAGVPVQTFTATAKSFAIDLKMRADDTYVRDAHVDSTPTFIVNGKYRLTPSSAGGDNQLIELVKWLVAKETK